MGRPIKFRLMDFVGTFSAMTLVIVLVSVSMQLSILSSVTFRLLSVVFVIVVRMEKLMSIQPALWNSRTVFSFILL